MLAHRCAPGLTLLLLACTVHGSTNASLGQETQPGPAADSRREGGTADPATSMEAGGGRRRREGGGGGGGEKGPGCAEGWLYTHHYCLFYTGLSEDQAHVFCGQRGALQVRGICVSRPSTSLNAALEPQRRKKDNLNTLTPSPSSSSSSFFSSSFSSPSSPTSPGHQCPSGWAQVGHNCYFNPGAASTVCELLGARYMLNLCVARVPHELPEDFVHTVQRLHGDDSHLTRHTRLCCCFGGGFC